MQNMQHNFSIRGADAFGISASWQYRIAGNFGGSKLWQMVLNLRFGEFNFGGLS